VGVDGKLNVIARIAHIRFVQNRIYSMRQRLINPAASHHVAAKKKAHELE
jgi:hypothetical protein